MKIDKVEVLHMEAFRDMLAHAQEVKATENLVEKLEALCNIAHNMEGNLALSNDFAAHSMVWSVNKDQGFGEMRTVFHGGLIYHSGTWNIHS